MFSFLYHMLFPQRVSQPSDLFETVIDFSKDGAGEICIYEVQSLIDSTPFTLFPNNSDDDYEDVYHAFYAQLFQTNSFHVIVNPLGASVGTSSAPKYVLKETCSPLHSNKIFQRLYFNLQPVLKLTMPEVVILSVKDVHDHACMSNLFSMFKLQKLIIKQGYAGSGEGNTFVDNCDSIASLKRALIKAFQALPEGQAFLLVEAQLQAYQAPEKDHRDVYRCACVLSHDFFNAQIITHYKIANNAANSHDFTQRTYFLTTPPITTYRHEGESVSVPDERVVPKAARNLDLENTKKGLFDRLKVITQTLASFDRQAFDAYDISGNTLNFDKVHFLSTSTRNQVISEAQAAAQKAKSRPPRP